MNVGGILNEGRTRQRPGRRTIWVPQAGQDNNAYAAAIEALNAHREVFQFGGSAVVMIRGEERRVETGTKVFETIKAVPVNATRLATPMENAIRWMARKDNGDEIEVRPPRQIMQMLCHRKGEGLTVLNGVADAPVWWKGQLLSGRTGYHEGTGLWLHCDPVEPVRFDSPKAALGYLLNEVFGESGFASRADAVRALAMPLTLLTRKTMIHGGAPAFLYSAAEPESGKSTLVRTLHLATCGYLPSDLSFAASREELRKAFFSALLGNPSMIYFDNVGTGWNIANETIERYVTADTYMDRLLGVSQVENLKATSVVGLSGNNLQIDSQDTATRLVTIRMERPTNPYTRDLYEVTMRDRAKILGAFVAILQADTEGAIKGCRFKAWGEVVGEKLIAVSGIPDLFDDWLAIDTCGRGSEELADLMQRMIEQKGAGVNAPGDGWGFSPGDMVREFQIELTDLRDAFQYGREGQAVKARAVNDLLAPHRDRGIGGLRLRATKARHPKRHRDQLFWHVEVEESAH